MKYELKDFQEIQTQLQIMKYTIDEGSFAFAILKKVLYTCIFFPPCEQEAPETKDEGQQQQCQNISGIAFHGIVVCQTVKAVRNQCCRIDAIEKWQVLFHDNPHIAHHESAEKTAGHDNGKHHSDFGSFGFRTDGAQEKSQADAGHGAYENSQKGIGKSGGHVHTENKNNEQKGRQVENKFKQDICCQFSHDDKLFFGRCDIFS